MTRSLLPRWARLLSQQGGQPVPSVQSLLVQARADSSKLDAEIEQRSASIEKIHQAMMAEHSRRQAAALVAPKAASPTPPPPDYVLALQAGRDPNLQVASAAPAPSQKPVSVAVVGQWSLPPISMLKSGGKAKITETEVFQQARLIEQTLSSFDAAGSVDKTVIGASSIVYGIRPGAAKRGTPVPSRKIVGLENDLRLALNGASVRFSNTALPGLLGLEVGIPPAQRANLALRDVLEMPAYTGEPHDRLPLAIGLNARNEAMILRLTDLPHLLIAGTTGSGKSVCLNSILIALLLQYPPEEVGLLLTDPKQVELSCYKAVPHLLSDVATTPEQSLGILKWAVKEMERRYKALADAGTRNIADYNATSSQSMQRIIIVIDELADLMLQSPAETEKAIQSLAQKARAAGLHLIIATQRPSVDVVTGVIKANLPIRLAFKVASAVDSRTIIDTGGAEDLAGNGDVLLFNNGTTVRGQGCNISTKEIDAVIAAWGKQGKGGKQVDIQPVATASSGNGANASSGAPNVTDDDLIEQAMNLAKAGETLSTSLIQRKLRIGYPRAARVMEIMRDRGLIKIKGA